jgi:hypothetical protein
MIADPFARLDEIATVLAPDRWMLVGGLMVHAHAQLAALPHVRPTDDADLVVELRAGTYAEAVGALEQLGYRRHEPLDPHAPLHRFTRPDGHVDLMAPDNRAVRFAGRDVVRVPGARSALERAAVFQTPAGTTIRIPDIASALSLKGAAYRTPSANPERHLQDAVTLFACAAATDMQVSKSMRANINILVGALNNPDAWAYSNASVRRLAIRSILSLRPDWTPPEFALPRRAPRTP